jgi:MFS family permease
VRRTFRSLSVRNYRLFFLGQLVSLTGSWMQTTALGWLVYTITKSPTQIGLVVAVQFVPTLIGSMHGGLLADRFDKRRILIGTQTALAVQAAVLATVALTGHATLGALYVLSFLQGCISTIDNPTRQSFVSEMVGPDEVTNAIGLNSAMFNTARIAGPAVAGALIHAVGTSTCFVLNAVSFVAVIGGLLAMSPSELHAPDRPTRAKGQLREGLRYAWGEPTLRMVLLMIAVIGTLAMNFLVILPAVAKQVFGGNSVTYGLMLGVMGVGALVGALLSAARGRPTVRLLAVASVAFGATMLVDAVATSLPMEMVALFATGMASITFMSSANATLQLTSRPDMRGRVMAIYMLLFLGSTPIGGPIIGWIGEQSSPRWSLTVGGVGCLVAALFTMPVLVRDWRGVTAAGLAATSTTSAA